MAVFKITIQEQFIFMLHRSLAITAPKKRKERKKWGKRGHVTVTTGAAPQRQ